MATRLKVKVLNPDKIEALEGLGVSSGVIEDTIEYSSPAEADFSILKGVMIAKITDVNPGDKEERKKKIRELALSLPLLEAWESKGVVELKVL